MIQIYLIGGLPGAGKSTYANELSESITNSFLTSDPMRLDSLLMDLNHVKNNKISNWIIESPHLSTKEAQLSMISFLNNNLNEHKLNWIIFENNPEQCRLNVAHRNDGRVVDATIKMYSKEYNIPEGALILPVANHYSASDDLSL